MDKTMFRLVRNCQTVFESDYTIFRFCLIRVKVLFAPHPLHHLLIPWCQILAMFLRLQWYLTFIYNSIVIYNAEHIFIFLFAICISSLVGCLLRPSVYFFNRVVCLFMLIFKSYMHFINKVLYYIYLFQIFAPSQQLIFSLSL